MPVKFNLRTGLLFKLKISVDQSVVFITDRAHVTADSLSTKSSKKKKTQRHFKQPRIQLTSDYVLDSASTDHEISCMS
jgi:hypothetical protein